MVDTERILLWLLLGGMSLGILALGFSAPEPAASAGSNPAVNIISANRVGQQAVVVAERAGPGILLSGAFIRTDGKQQQMRQDSCQASTRRCIFSADLVTGQAEVQICAVADLLPDQDFCDLKKL